MSVNVRLECNVKRREIKTYIGREKRRENRRQKEGDLKKNIYRRRREEER